jgi:hypothetical protein
MQTVQQLEAVCAPLEPASGRATKTRWHPWQRTFAPSFPSGIDARLLQAGHWICIG